MHAQRKPALRTMPTGGQTLRQRRDMRAHLHVVLPVPPSPPAPVSPFAFNVCLALVAFGALMVTGLRMGGVL